MAIDEKLIEKGASLILEGLGIAWKDDPNFEETPKRVSKAMMELNYGLFAEMNHIKVFPSKYTGIVCFKDIKTIGMCPHHLLPIEYNISFAYIPNVVVLGLSKVPRIISTLSARPVLQEELTLDIIDYFETKLQPIGSAVVIEGIHGCMKYRGIKNVQSVTTSHLKGVFFEQADARNELYKLFERKQI